MDYRLLCFASSNTAPPPTIPGFDPVGVNAVESAVARILGGEVDCVMLTCPRGVPEGALSVHKACEESMVPMVLAVDSRLDAGLAAMERLPVDGVVDLGWPPLFLSASVRAAMQRVLMGRNLADMQRRVLDAAEGEVHSLEHMVFRDELTGLYNLRSFREAAEREHARSSRHRGCYSVLMLDLDNLREVNTRHGHATGSRLLAEIGRVIRTDARVSDQAFRVGGDEFVVLLSDTLLEGALIVAGRLLRNIAALRVGEVWGTASAGVACYPEAGATSAEVVRRADEAMYRAKAQGRNRVVCAREESSFEAEAEG